MIMNARNSTFAFDIKFTNKIGLAPLEVKMLVNIQQATNSRRNFISVNWVLLGMCSFKSFYELFVLAVWEISAIMSFRT